MVKTEFVLIGAGDQGRVTADAIDAEGNTVVGFFDRRKCEPITGVFSSGDYDPDHLEGKSAIISIGGNEFRRDYSKVVKHPFGIVRHPTAIIARDVSIGEGSVILHGAILQTKTKIGKHAIVNTRASVDHDCEIGDFVHIAPGAVLCGRVKVGEGTLIGAGAVVLSGVTIGKWAVICAGAVVFKDVKDGAVMFGNPARLIEVKELKAI